jgi:hypothetical protein
LNTEIVLTEQETRMLCILLYVCSLDQIEKKMVMDDYYFEPEERFVMQEILTKLGGIDVFDLATGKDMSEFYKDIRKRMKQCLN